MSKQRIYLSPPHMGSDELSRVQEAFATNWIAPLGPHVDAFEHEFAAQISECEAKDGSIQAAALSSGTAALHLALRWLALKPGDEVIVSSLTFIASVNPVLYEGATPVFVDSETRSWNMDPALLAEAISDGIARGRKPRAVILVHLYGQSADLDPISALCERHGIPLIEDAAEALGAVYYSRRPVYDDPTGDAANAQRREVAPGTVGLCGVYSFNGNKIITTSGGGMLVSRDMSLVAKARFWATQSRDPASHYEHSEMGFNYRMSNVLAGIGRGQLRVLRERIAARRNNFAFYQHALGDLPGIVFMPEAEYGRSTRWLSCLTIDPANSGTDREQVRLALAGENIESRPVWKPMHQQPVFAGLRCYGGAVAQRLFRDGICLPSGSSLTQSDLERVTRVIRRCFGRR